MTKTILLVDDEMLVHMIASEVLEEAGYRVIAAHDGVAALKALDPEVDLIVTDVMMPRMDGPDWVRQARADGAADVPIIFTSAIARPGLVEEFPRAAFLPKPYRPFQLLNLVEQMLQGASGEDSGEPQK